MPGILEALGISPHDIDLLRDRNIPLDQPMPFDPSSQVPGAEPAVRVGDIAGMAMQSAPGVGDAYSALQAIKDLEEERYASSILNGIGALPMVAGMGAIKAYHGSPHKFDAFDMSKIGTGEGAQAYGHGLYFAESPNVARQYQESLTNLYGTPTKVSGGQDSVDIPLWLGEKIKSDGIDSAISEWSTRVAEQRAAMATSMQPWIHEGNAVRLENDLSILKKIKASGSAEVATPGALYETSLEWPDPAREAADPLGPQHFLDWDRPLSEQPKSVLSALSADKSDVKDWLQYFSRGRDLQGFSLLDAVSEARRQAGLPGGGKNTSVYLRDLGIPGIRYLDQGSRGAGDGTYNYVVFDDQIPKILNTQ